MIRVGDAVQWREDALIYTVADDADRPMLLIAPMRPTRENASYRRTGTKPHKVNVTDVRLIRGAELRTAYAAILGGDDDGAYRALSKARLRSEDADAELRQAAVFLHKTRMGES